MHQPARQLESHGLRNWLLLWPAMLAVMIVPFWTLWLVKAAVTAAFDVAAHVL